MQVAVEVRTQIARSLQGGVEAIVSETIGLYPFAGLEAVPPDDRVPLAERTLQLLTAAVRDGTLEADNGGVSELAALADQHRMDIRLLFTIIYLVERASLDALALDESFDVSAAPWPALSQAIRQASFELCAALAEHLKRAAEGAVTDTLTTLHTKGMFLAALDNQIQRSERLGEPFALMVIDVDRLRDINARYGYGAGDRVLERVGIAVRNYLRDTDWVARLGEDMFGVLLPAILGDNAERLAERMRLAVQQRLHVHDHRSDQHFPVTISVGVLVSESVERTERAERLIAAAEEAIARAKAAGGNRVERAALPAQSA
ncbi:MAG: GGDEF domain-containing protein [Acidobacteria bacterium]|nr:GGDEF domain-containing protein [Acidobacteriota bacterium]